MYKLSSYSYKYPLKSCVANNHLRTNSQFSRYNFLGTNGMRTLSLVHTTDSFSMCFNEDAQLVLQLASFKCRFSRNHFTLFSLSFCSLDTEDWDSRSSVTQFIFNVKRARSPTISQSSSFFSGFKSTIACNSSGLYLQ